MKTDKQQVIKDAWKNLWEKVKDSINENGWFDNSIAYEDCIKMGESKDIEMQYNFDFMRPLCLKGIETNNGWISIESEDDLPKELGSYFVYYPDGNIIIHHFSPNSDFDKILFMEEFTHYQPVSIPKSPIY